MQSLEASLPITATANAAAETTAANTTTTAATAVVVAITVSWRQLHLERLDSNDLPSGAALECHKCA